MAKVIHARRYGRSVGIEYIDKEIDGIEIKSELRRKRLHRMN